MNEQIVLNQIDGLPEKGIYTLIIFNSSDSNLKIGRLGTWNFPKGFYTYTGSGLGVGASSLINRVSRHLKIKKRKFWHIDYFLADKKTFLVDIFATLNNIKQECEINHLLKGIKGSKIIVPGFGASDCKKNCESHLLFFPKIPEKDILIRKVKKVYIEFSPPVYELLIQ